MAEKGYCKCGCGEKTWVATKNDPKLGWVKGEPVDWRKNHARKVPENLVETPDTNCWIWQHGTSSAGYGVRSPEDGEKYAHRIYYARHIGSLDPELTIDHLCSNRACVNPGHLEQVTRGENTLRGTAPSAQNKRKTHCIRGHKLEGDNLYVVQTSARETPKRVCKTCHRLRLSRAEARKAVAA